MITQNPIAEAADAVRRDVAIRLAQANTDGYNASQRDTDTERTAARLRITELENQLGNHKKDLLADAAACGDRIVELEHRCAYLKQAEARLEARLKSQRYQIENLTDVTRHSNKALDDALAQVARQVTTIKSLQEACSTFAASAPCLPNRGIRFTPEADAVLQAALRVDRMALVYVSKNHGLAFHALAKAVLAVLDPPAEGQAVDGPCCDVGSQVSYAVPPV